MQAAAGSDGGTMQLVYHPGWVTMAPMPSVRAVVLQAKRPGAVGPMDYCRIDQPAHRRRTRTAY